MDIYQFGSANDYLNYFNWNAERYLKILIPLLSIFLILVLIKFSFYRHLLFLKNKFNWPSLNFWEKIIKSFNNFFIFFLSFYWAFWFMPPVFTLEFQLQKISLIFLIFYLILVGQKFTKEIINLFLQLNEKENNFDKSFIYLIQILLNIILWLFGIIFTFQILGYNANTLLGGLGIVGIIVGFSLQNILGDFLAFFSIISDKPFKVGDFVKIEPNNSGTIIKIGLKNTRIKTFKGDELILSNKELLNRPLHNFGLMTKRHVDFVIGIEHQTSLKKLKKIPVLIEKIITNLDQIKFIRASFNEISPQALNFEIIYQVLTNDYNLYVLSKEKINYQIYEIFEKEKIKFAHPTQTIFVHSIK